MTQHFSTRQWVPLPVDLVFAFFADPLNLPRLMPPAQKTRVEALRLQPPPVRPTADPDCIFCGDAAGVGSEILISFSPVPGIPHRVRWTARILEFEWNSHFCDEQVQGPFARFHHRHGTVAERRDGQMGTLVTDDIEYVLPLGSMGRLASPIVRRQLERSFAERQLRLPRMLSAAARQLTHSA